MGHLDRYLYSDIEDLQKYTNAVKDGNFPISRLTSLSVDEEMRKSMMLIYIRNPLNRNWFKREYGRFPEEIFSKELEKLQNKGLIETINGNIQLTEKGDPWRFNIAWEFFENKQHE